MELPEGYQESLFSRYWTSEISVLLDNSRINKLQQCIKSVNRHPISFEKSFVVMSQVWIQHIEFPFLLMFCIKRMNPIMSGNILHLPQHKNNENPPSMSLNMP